MIKLAAALSLSLISSTAIAAEAHDPSTGWELLAQCRGGEVTDIVACTDYLRGVWDGLAASSYVTKHTFACTGGELITAGTMRKVYLAYAANNPADLHFSAGVVVTVAFAKTFPCAGN